MKVPIRPGVNVLGVLKHLEYKPWFALAEFVDNAVQSFCDVRRDIPGQDAVRVSIDIDRADKTITITDNAGGIRESDMARAFRPAEPPLDAAGLSQFGMGMKSAACWFSPEWDVRTSALGESVERLVCFDMQSILENQIEELDVRTTAVEPSSHYTVISLRNVHQLPQGRTLGKIREHLTDIYRCFIRDGSLELLIPGVGADSAEPLVFIEPETLQAPLYTTDNEPIGDSLLWQKDIAFELSDGRVVCGQAGLLARGDTRGAGLCLFRRSRAIVGTGDEKYRPLEIFRNRNSFESQRVWGELHMDDFDVSHTKDGFRWGDSEDEFLTALRTALDDEPLPLLKQARNYRMGRAAQQSSNSAATAAVDSVATALAQHGGTDIERISDLQPNSSPPPPVLDPVDHVAIPPTMFEIATRGEVWRVTVELGSEDNTQNWLEIASAVDEAHRTCALALRVQVGSPFMRRIVRLDEQDSLEPVVRLAAAVGLAEILARMGGGRSGPGEIRRNINELLRSSLSHREAQ